MAKAEATVEELVGTIERRELRCWLLPMLMNGQVRVSNGL
jgi:hypothetical protein